MALIRRPLTPAVFLDKDGTLIENIPYNADPEKIRLMPGTVEGLMRLRSAGYRLFVISNQPGIALGWLTNKQLSTAYRQIGHLIAQQTGGHSLLEGFYFCPHLPRRQQTQGGDRQAGCGCRKPARGMLMRAAHEHHLQLARSWMIGDILDDVEAGHRAGCRSVLIDNGNETEWLPGPLRIPDVVACRLDEAAAFIYPESSARQDGD